MESFLAPPPARGGDLGTLPARLDEAADCALETAGPGHLAYVPGSGLYSATLAEFYNRAVNRYGGLASVAPAFAALEESVIRWMARDVCGLPAGGGLCRSAPAPWWSATSPTCTPPTPAPAATSRTWKRGASPTPVTSGPS